MKQAVFFVSWFLAVFSFTKITNAAETYDPVYQVNDSIITKYELDQRIKMLRAFSTSGNLQQQAVDQLIEDRLRFQAAAQAGITITEADIYTGMEEFAARGNLSADQLIIYLEERNVDREAFEDFVRAGILWRNVIGARFASKVTITDEEVDAQLDTRSINFPKTLRIAEIILPTDIRGPAKTRALANRLTKSIKSENQFAAAAQKYSTSNTAPRGGDLGWLPLTALPDHLSGLITRLKAGEMTKPIELENAIALYQLLGIREAKSANQQVLSVSYLTVAIPHATFDRDRQIQIAQKLINESDTCLDMTANAGEIGENLSNNHSLPAGRIPPRIRAELSHLDPNEARYYQAEAGQINVVMLCNRAKDLPEGARDQIRSALFGQRIDSFGSGYLQELRNDAVIIKK